MEKIDRPKRFFRQTTRDRQTKSRVSRGLKETDRQTDIDRDRQTHEVERQADRNSSVRVPDKKRHFWVERPRLLQKREEKVR